MDDEKPGEIWTQRLLSRDRFRWRKTFLVVSAKWRPLIVLADHTDKLDVPSFGRVAFCVGGRNGGKVQHTGIEKSTLFLLEYSKACTSMGIDSALCMVVIKRPSVFCLLSLLL